MSDITENLTYGQVMCRIQFFYDYMQRYSKKIRDDSCPISDDKIDIDFRRGQSRTIEELMITFENIFEDDIYYG